MIYLDNAATTLRKPPSVLKAVDWAMRYCANPGRGGHKPAMRAAETVFHTRSLAAEMFDCDPEQVCFTANATEGLNIAIRTLVSPKDRVVVSCLEHNAVTRTVNEIGAKLDPVCPEDVFSAEDWISAFEKALSEPAAAVVCMQVSNVFGCRLPVEELSNMCSKKAIPLIVDASQSAGILPISLRRWRASFIAMPGHKALFGPQGTGLLLCGTKPKVLISGGTGSLSAMQTMPELLPDRLEAGTRNVPGISGLGAGLEYVKGIGLSRILRHDSNLVIEAARDLREMGCEVYTGKDQTGVLSFRVKDRDPETFAERLAEEGIAVRAGLHCAPLAHQSMGTFPSGTVRASVCAFTSKTELQDFLLCMRRILHAGN